jgi:hypothetical protein
MYCAMGGRGQAGWAILNEDRSSCRSRCNKIVLLGGDHIQLGLSRGIDSL